MRRELPNRPADVMSLGAPACGRRQPQQCETDRDGLDDGGQLASPVHAIRMSRLDH
jgi:hypothetical protein